MKKIIKKIKSNSLFTFILGGLIFGSIGIYGANNYQSNAIEYNPTDTSWEVSNVNEALNSLYKNQKTSKIEKYAMNIVKYGYRDCRIDISKIDGYENLTIDNIIVSINNVGLAPTLMDGWASGEFHIGNYDASNGIITMTSNDYYTFQGVWPLNADVYIIR